MCLHSSIIFFSSFLYDFFSSSLHFLYLPERDFISPYSFFFKSKTDKSNEINYKVAILMRHFSLFFCCNSTARQSVLKARRIYSVLEAFTFSFIYIYWFKLELNLLYCILNCNKSYAITLPSFSFCKSNLNEHNF
jgi:hypothetical protein